MVEVANIGLCGAHRVGKTTLANALSRVRSMRFVRTNTSGIFNEYNIDPAKPMAFPSRLSIQHRILDAAEEIWSKERSVFVTDRTPLDMAAYTLADVQGSTTVDFKELHNYLSMCFRITNRFFGTVILVQPGIPLVYQHGKAALNEAYIEHINSLILGLCHDERLHCRVLQLGREMISIEERVNAVVNYCTPTPIKH
jgi:hypothetical protein